MFLLEGNIGAGKSTFLELIKKHLHDVNVLPEPVNVWQQDTCGKSLLNNFYSDPNRWGYTMESFTLINRVFESNQIEQTAMTIGERSIYSGFFCFARNSYLNGFMTRLEWKIYKQWFEFLTNSTNHKQPTGFIYLKTSPELAYTRIQKRNRFAENLISIKYIRQIHERHEDFLLKDDGLMACAPVLTLDAEVDFESDPVKLHKMLETVSEFINNQQQPKSTATNHKDAQGPSLSY